MTLHSGRRVTVRLTDAEAAVIADIKAAHPHLTRSGVVHLMFEDKRQVVARALSAAPTATKAAVRLDATALAVVDGAAEALNRSAADLRQMRTLANQMARASNSGDPLVAAQLARLTDAVEATTDAVRAVGSTLNGVTSWHN